MENKRTNGCIYIRRAGGEVTLVIVSIVLMLLTSCTASKPDTSCKRIMEIGACNHFGTCSVRYSDSSLGIEAFPIQGKLICSNTDSEKTEQTLRSLIKFKDCLEAGHSEEVCDRQN